MEVSEKDLGIIRSTPRMERPWESREQLRAAANQLAEDSTEVDFSWWIVDRSEGNIVLACTEQACPVLLRGRQEADGWYVIEMRLDHDHTGRSASRAASAATAPDALLPIDAALARYRPREPTPPRPPTPPREPTPVKEPTPAPTAVKTEARGKEVIDLESFVWLAPPAPATPEQRKKPFYLQQLPSARSPSGSQHPEKKSKTKVIDLDDFDGEDLVPPAKRRKTEHGGSTRVIELSDDVEPEAATRKAEEPARTVGSARPEESRERQPSEESLPTPNGAGASKTATVSRAAAEALQSGSDEMEVDQEKETVEEAQLCMEPPAETADEAFMVQEMLASPARAHRTVACTHYAAPSQPDIPAEADSVPPADEEVSDQCIPEGGAQSPVVPQAPAMTPSPSAASEATGSIYQDAVDEEGADNTAADQVSAVTKGSTKKRKPRRLYTDEEEDWFCRTVVANWRTAPSIAALLRLIVDTEPYGPLRNAHAFKRHWDDFSTRINRNIFEIAEQTSPQERQELESFLRKQSKALLVPEKSDVKAEPDVTANRQREPVSRSRPKSATLPKLKLEFEEIILAPLKVGLEQLVAKTEGAVPLDDLKGVPLALQDLGLGSFEELQQHTANEVIEIFLHCHLWPPSARRLAALMTCEPFKAPLAGDPAFTATMDVFLHRLHPTLGSLAATCFAGYASPTDLKDMSVVDVQMMCRKHNVSAVQEITLINRLGACRRFLL